MKKEKWGSRLYFTGLVIGGLLACVCWIFVVVPPLKNTGFWLTMNNQQVEEAAGAGMPSLKALKADIESLKRKLERLTPGGAYLVVNTSDNTFFLYKRDELVRNGICSTGSYVKLELNDEKHWIFETPKGVFSIRGKTTAPVWRKPDWAFIEEGLPVPSANDPSRYEYGVLGDYALSLGDGYLIHGTLYKRFLGMPVTHGCIRMNDEDLEAVYSTLPVGAKVFIY